MQSIDGISKYQNHVVQTEKGGQTASLTEGSISGSKGALSAAVSGTAGRQESIQLPKGTVFEGVVTEVKDGFATLSLSNGQTMRARLDSGVNVRLGEPVLFEVKSSQENQITIKQVPLESQYNPTLQKALSAAGLPLTQRNLTMVNTMMQQQLPIDKGSLTAMARLLQGNPMASAETLVQMQKLGFPVNEPSVQQFEAYKAGEHSLTERFDQLMEQLPQLLQEAGGGISKGGDVQQLVELQKGILDALELLQQGENRGQPEGVQAEDPGAAGSVKGEAALNSETAVGTDGMISGENSVNGKTAVGTDGMIPGDMNGKEAVMSDKTAGATEALAKNQAAAETHPLTEFLSKAELGSLEQQLRQIPGMENNALVFADGKLNTSLSAGELLRAIHQQLEQQTGQGGKAIGNLLKGKEYGSLLRQAMEEQWLLEPQQTENKQNIEKLYERLNRQMERLEQFLQSSGKESMGLNKNISQVRGNLEMMNQINQLYNYVQLPLKLHGQNANSDLYVYTNKKKLQDKEGELSALLHLELDHLGTTDVQIKMMGTSVKANFYLSDEAACRLVEQHVGGLLERLEQKGYQCRIHLEQKEQRIDFVEDFLEHEAPIGRLQRYSFDVLT